MKIEIITHVYAIKYPHYAKALVYQLSSLLLFPPKNVDVKVTLCCDPKDNQVEMVFNFFRDKLDLGKYFFDIDHLGRRAIGRNNAAILTEADVIWFTDVDYLFRENCLDSIPEPNQWPDNAIMIYPKQYRISPNHEMGDQTLMRVEQPEIIDIDTTEFVSRKSSMAVGGMFIVNGNFAREHGYLENDPNWRKPTNGVFKSCKCDVPYRKFCKRNGGVKPVNIFGVYRIRHSVAAHGRKPEL